ncbi:hypothetical protein AB1K62_10485 [Parasphingorhabdus sp. JC815]|uniref:hypothetical protein n=1 Tax=Parasphingorhabdus sp. JC815 TaxID=3232140 RepID=UPI00345AC3B9
MRLRPKHISLATVGIAALALSLPVLGQSSPESLLPPGFGDPDPAPAPTPSPTPSPAPTPAPRPSSSNTASGPASGSVTNSSGMSSEESVAAGPDSLDEGEVDLGAIDERLMQQYYLPSKALRSMDQIGVLTESSGGMKADAFGGEGGQYLTNLIKNLHGPIISRWASILLRRTLLSNVNSPENIDPADWVAERAWRLLRMGEAEAARALVLKVDASNFTPRLYTVAMQAHLATADPAGVCPYVYGGSQVNDEPTWIFFRPICASLSGEQSRATTLLREARQNKVATGIDYLLTEKTVGAGFDGRRAVTLKWDDIQYFNNWRFGLGLATGVEPPDRLYEQAGRHVQGWRVRAPMLSRNSRMKAADTAAAIGVLSNRAMVDLYAATYDDPEANDDLKARASLLRQAYNSATAERRIEAMRALWDRSDGALTSYSAIILTARAAARIPASDALADSSGQLIASMLSAGLDRNAALWANTVKSGSYGWALLAVGAPDVAVTVDYSALDQFGDNDESAGQLKSKFLLAALAGLGRVEGDALQKFSSDLDLNLAATSRWSEAIRSAAQRGQGGTVALLAAVGMQGRSWNAMSPLHLFHITRALSRVGMEAEARMIAAEALMRIP